MKNHEVRQRLITQIAMLKTDVELTIAVVLKATVSRGYRYAGSDGYV